jgi:hypothetical protein
MATIHPMPNRSFIKPKDGLESPLGSNFSPKTWVVRQSENRLLGPGNKAWHAGSNHRVEPNARLDVVPNLPHGVFSQG